MENSDLQALHSSMAMLSSSSSMAKPLDEEFKLNYDNFPRFNPRIIRIGEKSEQFPTKIGGSTSEVRVIKTELPGGGANNVKWLVDVKNSNSERAELVNVPETATIGVLGKGVYAINYEDASEKGKSKVKIPAHIPMIPKPQDVYQIRVNNSNQPFNHIWLQSGDGTRFVHPLESLSAGEFYSQSFIRSNPNVPIRYVPIESTQFTYVDDVQHLKALVAVLHNVNEFAVDLEHNHYRSFQGMTCLMQISTRTEDFIVDTLKLWVYIGPYLRDFFKDPRKRKVMHGADKDILWLQRDFGIYVCNLFDTGQAARVLNMERHSLEHLLRHYCNVSANKEYQTADWRLRPIPEEMLRYAREDTHYLLYIYDMMRMELLKLAGEPGRCNLPLLEVYTRSYDICLQLYTKEVLTSSSYLNIFGLQDAGLNAQQLAVVAGLCEWRDMVARVEDESTGYILPNKTLIQIGKEMPVSTSKLWQLVKTKHPVVSRNMDTIVSIIRHSMLKADSYQSAVEHLNLRRMELEHGEHSVNISGIEMLPSDSSTYIQQRDLLQDPKLLQESGRIIDLPQSHTGGASIEEKGVSTKALSHLSPSFVKYVEPVKENRKTNLSGKLFPVEAI